MPSSLTMDPTSARPAQTVEQARSFVAFVTRGALADGVAVFPPAGRDSWNRDRLSVQWSRRTPGGQAPHVGMPTLILGDASEYERSRPDQNLAGGVPVRFDDASQSVVIHTSIVGLPPVYVYRGQHVTAVASDIYLLCDVPGVELELDARSVSELGAIGHPVGQRTLFRDVTLAPSASRLVLDAEGRLQEQRSWSLQPQTPLSLADYVEAQIVAFEEAVRRLDLSDAFLSLTAGLDTRTVFAALAAQKRAIPAATMTAVTRSLDARAAAELSRAYGVAHHEVVFDARFARDLPKYVEIATRLSGGLASLDQAPEVFFYTELDNRFGARLSGNLGNQVGRGGTEGVSTRGADVRILARDLREANGGGSGHWLLDELHADARSRLEFILTREIPFTLASNYPIGNHFARQLTPYASRPLIETLARRPVSRSGPSRSKLHMRLRDLSHRFLGEPASSSFQRTLLRRIGGFAAHYPINWGWRAQGGVSPRGLALGVATLGGMYARSRGWDTGIMRQLPALHDFRESRRWLRDSLREFTLDTLATGSSAGVFDPPALNTLLTDHFSGRRDNYATVTFALDVALARSTFRVRS